MNISDLPDFDDKFIGEAILTIMFFFMFVWITSGASPINFPMRASTGVLVSHLEVILVAVIPLALLGLIQSMRGGSRTGASALAERLATRAKTYRKSHSGKYTYRRTSKEETKKVK